MRYIPTIIRGIEDDTEMLPIKDDISAEGLGGIGDGGGGCIEGGRD
jgi:hypothetical protein